MRAEGVAAITLWQHHCALCLRVPVRRDGRQQTKKRKKKERKARKAEEEERRQELYKKNKKAMDTHTGPAQQCAGCRKKTKTKKKKKKKRKRKRKKKKIECIENIL